MKLNVINDDTKVTLTFTPREYVLVHGKDDRYQTGRCWTLNPKIDRSFKGKDFDLAEPTVYLTDNEVKIFKEAGFSYIETEMDTH